MKKYKNIILCALFILVVFIVFDQYGNDIMMLNENSQPSIINQVHKREIVKNAKRLPTCGPNFRTYSRLLSAIGRTHVHSQLRLTLLDSYKKLESTMPKITWIYAETGWKNGGNFWPHKTHRNGLCVDFMVPILDKKEKTPTTLFLWPFNGYGYNTRFDSKGAHGNYEIDFASIVMHIIALKEACSQNGLSIKRIIFDPPLLKILKGQEMFNQIADIPFMEQHAWFPHDSHYHIDFTIMRLNP